MGTDEGFFSSVDVPVIPQGTRVCEQTPTALPGTDTGSFSGVDAPVRLQVGQLCARMSTAFPGTDKGFFPGVDAQVRFQVGQLCARIATAFPGTDKGFFPGVDAPVLHQASFVPEPPQTPLLQAVPGSGTGADRTPGQPARLPTAAQADSLCRRKTPFRCFMSGCNRKHIHRKPG